MSKLHIKRHILVKHQSDKHKKCPHCDFHTGYSLSEALILAAINPKRDYRLFMELVQVLFILCTSNCFNKTIMFPTGTELVVFLYRKCNCMSASDKK